MRLRIKALFILAVVVAGAALWQKMGSRQRPQNEEMPAATESVAVHREDAVQAEIEFPYNGVTGSGAIADSLAKYKRVSGPRLPREEYRRFLMQWLDSDSPSPPNPDHEAALTQLALPPNNPEDLEILAEALQHEDTKIGLAAVRALSDTPDRAVILALTRRVAAKMPLETQEAFYDLVQTRRR